ncbi:MAG: ribosomal protein S18-alanine N-acetyltransferase [Gammaproteobacteria bacterium]|nr:ribosomal protein S18-alanine N-acetyltransferase [Gammaproteobacteria bacterium]NNF66735.1 ribosomal protein S18-alanine N-acetyltransferase [Gammaproteobacteria bacterium]
MRRADVVRVAEIEQKTYPFPWSLDIFIDCLKTGYLCRILDSDDGLAAYAIISVGAGEAHILNLCVVPERRRQKTGRHFLRELIAELSSMAIQRVILEVRPSNEAAQALYAGEGFKAIGLRRNYYPADSGREDALVLARTLQAAR